jgi:hypothetical protein
MMQVMASGWRHARPYSLACVSAVVITLSVGTARGQYTPPAPRLPTPSHLPRPSNPWQADQMNRWWEQNRNNSSRYDLDFPNLQGTVRAVNDAAVGTAIAIALGGGLFILLIGLFIFRRLRSPIYARNQALDDPRLRALLADMAEQGKKAQAKAKQETTPPPGASAQCSATCQEGIR